MSLKLGLMTGYWGAEPPANIIGTAQQAEKLGYWGFFTAEAYGSDALTPLAWVGAHTSTIKLGTAIVQISARTPTATAMHALTLDHLSQGRMILGLGVSGPQVVEGWYGQPFAKPLSRTREYISIIRQVLERQQPVVGPGPHYTLPYPADAPGSWGLGKPLKPITHPLRANLPIFLGAEGPKNVTMAAETCDGWYPLYYSPWRQEVYAENIASRPEGFEILYPMKLHITDDLEAGRLEVKKNLALYIGGMGAKDRNFHNELIVRMGYADAARKIQDLFLDGKKREAVAAVPDELVDEIALVGPKDRIRQQLAAWDDSPVTGLMVWPKAEGDLETFAELLLDR
ncbi:MULTISPECIES: LLM class F420-dependent oxidoreductase [unclassified Minwuia]|jgi:F420-dependent oxidoreductase-like protein|uniref:LLM class F420-dependent oxidoreductase n=1 Tax=unclassified Minwuia TaxID=2618799 RepID=UPI002479C491|nr:MULTISPECIES: LLM class F420-dependent oxidoreductase [unclassified Minwuia]